VVDSALAARDYVAVICRDCGHANREGAIFCTSCGQPLALTCASCGAGLAPEARFCDTCGAATGGQERPANTTAVRKVVSVLFADLAGSTELQEALDPESARRVMTRFYEVMRSAVQRHEGTVEKFIGDAVVALFGAPTVQEDDAIRAVRCAAAMVEDLNALNEELEPRWGVRLRMRVGVNTGELVLSSEGLLVGDTVNTAARLEQAAPAGVVLIGEATQRLVRHHVKLDPVRLLQAKGKAKPLPAWLLVSASSGPDEALSAAAEAPFVGRVGELRRLDRALNAVISGRGCRLVTVIGSPGVGKSRIVAEFARAVTAKATVVEGHCEPSGEGITFLPVAEVLRGLAGIEEADAPNVVLTKLAGLADDEPDRDRLVAVVGSVLGASAPASVEESFWGLRRTIEAVARRRPLVIVLDDVQWGQPMFLDLAEHLIDWVRDAPILLVALARPELRETRDAFTSAGRRALDVIELAPLKREESRTLLDLVLGVSDLPQPLIRRILDTTEGNPLYLGELLRMLIDEGSLARSDDVWMAVGGIESVEVPPTIQALLAARIERLRSDERTVLERAAVIGQQFYRGAVADLAPAPVSLGLDAHLETLRRKDMVEPEGTYWIDEPVFRFHHALIRDAAYHLLLKELRAELHERFADWLHAKAGDFVGEHEEVIAYHLEQAHEYRRQLGPLDARGRRLGARAADRLYSAGERALAREDLAAASNLLRRALDRGAGQDSEILWDLAETLLSAGDTAAAAEIVERLRAGAAGDEVRRARSAVLGGQLALLTGVGDLEQIVADVSAAASELAAADDGRGAGKAHHVVAEAQGQLGHVGAVESALDDALLAARKAGDRRRITAVLAAAPRAALWGPSPVVSASGRCLDVVRILRMEPGNRYLETNALRCQAVLEAMRGRFDAARAILRAARATVDELGLSLELQELAAHAGMVELLAGAPPAAEALLREARDGFEALGAGARAALAAALLARALVEQGRDEEAIEQTEFAEAHAGGDLKTTITWCGVRAGALARGGRHHEALALARRAVELAEPTDALADKADAAMALTGVLLASGDSDRAADAAHLALGLYAAKGHTAGAERALELAGDRPRPASAEPAPAPVILGDRPPERFWAEYQRLYSAHDVDALLRMYVEDWVVKDHRALGWGEARGRKHAEALLRSVLSTSPNLRLEVDDVLACDDRVIAMRYTWRGHGVKAGEVALSVGAVTVIEDGLWASLDLYEPDDDEAMLSRYAELGGHTRTLGDRPPEQLVARFMQAIAEHDVGALLDLPADGCRIVDHGDVGWERLGSEEDARSLAGAIFATWPELAFTVAEVLACDDRVIALRGTWRGVNGAAAGHAGVRVGLVWALDSGRVASVDIYGQGDRAAMVSRYAELGGGAGALGRRPLERLVASWLRMVEDRDIEAIGKILAQGIMVSDHRSLGTPLADGRDAALELLASASERSGELSFRVADVLACDERALACHGSLLTHGSASEARVNVPLATVLAVHDGLLASIDIYEPDDVNAIRRFTELAAASAPLERG
jgi:class 3 adenylate cyclase/ketosteroid isomerase-like protein/tetratricopeptide (TPR) repeat protein